MADRFSYFHCIVSNGLFSRFLIKKEFEEFSVNSALSNKNYTRNSLKKQLIEQMEYNLLSVFVYIRDKIVI